MTPLRGADELASAESMTHLETASTSRAARSSELRTLRTATTANVQHSTQLLRSCELAWAHLKLVWKAQPDPFVITSVRPHPLLPRIAHGLALASANPGPGSAPVLLIDADLPSQPLSLLLTGAGVAPLGLADLLRSGSRIEEVARTLSPGVVLLPGGGQYGSGASVLASGEMHQLLAQARAQFSAVIICAPPMAAGPDAAILAAQAENVVLAVGAIDEGEAATARASLDACGAMLRGLIYLDPSATKLRV